MSAELMRHIETRGVETRIAPELRPDLERGARRVRIFQRAGVEVELSPYMKSLMGLEGIDCDTGLERRGSGALRDA